MTGMMSCIIKKVLKGVKHPVHAFRFIMRCINEKLLISEYAKASERGQRVVLRTTWEIAKSSKDFVILAHLQRYEWVIQQLRSSTTSIQMLIDVGCGSGYGTARIAKYLGATFIVGVDVSKAAIAYASKQFDAPNLWFKRMDGLTLQFPPAVFDVVISFDVLEHLTREQQHLFLHSIVGVLKPTGLLYLGCPNRKVSLGNNPHHRCELSSEEFVTLLSQYFINVRVLCQDIIINGERKKENWHRYTTELNYINLGIFDYDCDNAFGLLSVCSKPKQQLMAMSP